MNVKFKKNYLKIAIKLKIFLLNTSKFITLNPAIVNNHKMKINIMIT